MARCRCPRNVDLVLLVDLSQHMRTREQIHLDATINVPENSYMKAIIPLSQSLSFTSLTVPRDSVEQKKSVYRRF